jgi:hypothetical protein
VIPSLERIKEVVDRNLVLWNWPYPKSSVVEAISQLLRRWALKHGKEAAARKAEIVFANPTLLVRAKNAPTEKVVDMIGEFVDDTERRTTDGADENLDGGDQRVLPRSGTSPEGCVGGPEPDCGGEDGGDGGALDGGAAPGGELIEFPTERRSRRTGTREGLHRSHIVLELEEHEKDLRAFRSAYASVHQRVQEVKDDQRLMKLVNWSGTSAVMGTLELTIHAIERVVEELKEMLSRIDRGVIPDLDRE